jgi:hypothetical protein
MLQAACIFDYGFSPEQLSRTAGRIRGNVIGQRMALVQAVDCGITATLLAFVGITLAELTPRYLLEDILAHLKPDWTTFKLLQFSPLMLTDVANMPLIVLYDLLGLRAHHLYEYDLSRETLSAALGESGVALLRARMELWPSKVVE